MYKRQAQNHHDADRQVVLIGHAGHPEVLGTTGQLPPGSVDLIETVADALTFVPDDPDNLAYVTQTTLSVDDTAEIVATLRDRFPNIAEPRKQDICYATTNRQTSVRQIAPNCDLVLVIGAPNRSNSNRLVEVALRAGCPEAKLVQGAGEIPWDSFAGVKTLGITAGASAPEVLVDEVVASCRQRFDVTVETVRTAEETIAFNIPRVLRETTSA